MNQPSTIRTFALVVVSITSAFLIGIAIWLITILSAADWCNRAVGAAIIANKGEAQTRPEYAVSGCFDLLKLQVDALAGIALWPIAVIALCLLALIVIVVAGGRLSFRASKDGAEANIGRDGS